MGKVKGYVYNNILALDKIELNKAKEAFFAKITEFLSQAKLYDNKIAHSCLKWLNNAYRFTCYF